MAQNPIPNDIDLLIALGEKAADGAAAHETAIGLLQNTEARIRSNLTALQTAQQAFLTARTASVNATAAKQAADANGRAFIAAAKGVLAPVLGGQWSSAWLPTGFVNSLAVPKRIDERLTLLGMLRDYFTANTSHENAPLNVTAAQATSLHTALSDAQAASAEGLVDKGQKRAARNTARTALEKRLRGLIYELDQLLGPTDPIWLAFGLNMPGGETTPEAPSALVLTPGGPGEVLADWDDVPSADHYRVFKQEVGVDADFVHAGSPSDSDFTIEGVTGGNVLRVKVSAVSGSLEGPTSDVAEITVGGVQTTPFNTGVNGTDTEVWALVPAGLAGLQQIKLVHQGDEFVTAFSPPPGTVGKTTWPGKVIVGQIDEVKLQNGAGEALAVGVFDPALPDPGP